MRSFAGKALVLAGLLAAMAARAAAQPPRPSRPSGHAAQLRFVHRQATDAPAEQPAPAPAAPPETLGQEQPRPRGSNPRDLGRPTPIPAELLPPPVESPAARGLTLAEAESLALNNNPTLTAASARVAVVRGQLRQAWLYPNPMLGYSGMEIGDDGTAGQHGAMVSQNIITGGKRRLDRAALAQEVQHREAAFAAQRLRVLTDVRLRFNEALVAQRQLELLRELVEIADEAVKATERLAEVKQIPLHVLLQTQIEAENARVLLDNAQTEFAEALQRLLAVMAVPDFEIGEVSGELTTGLPMLEFGEVLKGILGNSPELAAAWADVRRGEYLLTRARREPIPDLEVAAAVRYSAISEFTNADLNLRIPLPIFDRNQGNIDKAQAELAMAHAEVRRIELDLTDRLAMVFRGYEFARQAVRRYEEEIIPRARRSLELIDEGYRVGQSDYLALLTAQRTYTQVTLEHLRAVRQLRENGFRIEGQLLSGSLMPSP